MASVRLIRSLAPSFSKAISHLSEGTLQASQAGPRLFQDTILDGGRQLEEAVFRELHSHENGNSLSLAGRPAVLRTVHMLKHTALPTVARSFLGAANALPLSFPPLKMCELTHRSAV